MSGEPPWLVAAVDQRLAQMKEVIGNVDLSGQWPFILTPLTEPPEGASKQLIEMWDRTCDHCEKYCPGKFHVGMTTRDAFGVQVSFTFGVCPACKEEWP